MGLIIKFISLFLGTLFFFQPSMDASETVKGAQKDYEKFKIEMASKLDSVEKQLDELREKVKKNGSMAQQEAINDLERTQVQLKIDLENMKETGKTNWSKVKTSFAESLNRLNARIQKAIKD